MSEANIPRPKPDLRNARLNPKQPYIIGAVTAVALLAMFPQVLKPLYESVFKGKLPNLYTRKKSKRRPHLTDHLCIDDTSVEDLTRELLEIREAKKNKDATRASRG